MTEINRVKRTRLDYQIEASGEWGIPLETLEEAIKKIKEEYLDSTGSPMKSPIPTDAIRVLSLDKKCVFFFELVSKGNL